MKINSVKRKAIRFTRARVKNSLGYSLDDQKILGNYLTKRFKLGGPSKLQSAKSLEGISLCNACSQKKEIGIQNLADTSLVRPVLECWDHAEKD